MGLILDSSILIAAERGKFDLLGLYAAFRNESLFISSITLSELWHGYHRANSSVREQRLAYIRRIEATIAVLDFTPQEALAHSKIWSGLEATGKMIGPYDLIIAATAISHDCSVATLNESEFGRVHGLKLVPIKRFVRS